MAIIDGFPLAIVVSFSLFYSSIFLLSVVGNVIVLCHCYWKIKRGPSPLKWFIANLAISDLMFSVLSLLDFIAYLWTWLGGNASCKLQGYVIEACYTTSIMTLALISYERRKVVVTPFRARTDAPYAEYKKLIAIWIYSLVIGSPLLYAYEVEMEASGSFLCTNTSFGDLGKQVYYSIYAVCVFIIPLVYMIYAQSSISLTLRTAVISRHDTVSSARHRKVAKTLAALSIAFAVCWAPFIIFRTLVYFHVLEGLRYFWAGCQILICINTVLDPILYGIYGENIKAFLRLFFNCRHS